ncbi:MAG: DUF523 domain-containing protein [Candidatus Omnitrophica bacterium]|nr:DUF523 domain-containing protein [Candidatus Omnitrophota bacterium]
MRKFEKPVVVLSKCLEFEACRYNGQVIPDSFIKKLIPHVDFMPVCPEVEIGLGTPRAPIRLVEEKEKIHLMQSGTLADVTHRMTSFSKKYLDSLKDVDGFILKSRSPSCGLKEVSVYRSLEKSASIGKRTGLFAEAVLNAFPGLAIEDEGRLLNLKIREHSSILVI